MRSLSDHPRDVYIRALYTAETTLLARIRTQLAAQGIAMSVSPEEGKILQVLVRMSGAKHVVEIGTLAGYSALWMAGALPEGGTLTCFEKSPQHAALARAHFAEAGLASRITLVEGDAHQTLRAHTAPVDLVFIDAEKAGYPDYLSWAQERLKPGGVVIADNTLLFGSVYAGAPLPKQEAMWQAMRTFNASFAQQFESIVLPTAEGLSVGVKR